MAKREETLGITLGFILVIIVNLILAFIVGVQIAPIIVNNIPYLKKVSQGDPWRVIFISISSIWIYQFIYVAPLIFLLKRAQKLGWMKGIIIGAVMTALVAGWCFMISI